VATAGGFVAMLRYDRRLVGTWPEGDKRNNEAKIYATLAFVGFVVFVAATFFFWPMELPEWGRSVVTFLAQLSSFLIKVLFFSWVFIWVRWSLPRFRYDQIMRLGWKQLIPLSFANIFVTGVIVLLIDHFKS
jgi:NADH-quinone oxidoreductase subunit H